MDYSVSRSHYPCTTRLVSRVGEELSFIADENLWQTTQASHAYMLWLWLNHSDVLGRFDS